MSDERPKLVQISNPWPAGRELQRATIPRAMLGEKIGRLSPEMLRSLTSPLAPWQRRHLNEQIREMSRRSVLSMREFEGAMRETAITVRKIAHAFRVPLRLLLGTKATREREQVLAMQRWARRRGRRKGRA